MEERERDSALAESESGLIAQTETPKSVKYGRGVRKLKETGPTFESFKKTQPNLVRRIEKYNKAFDKLLSIAKEIEAEHEDLSDDALKRKIDEFNKRAERLGRLGVRVIAFDDDKKKIGLAGVGVKAINVPSRLTGLLSSLNVAAYSEPYQAAEDAIIERAKSAIKDNDGKLTLKSYDILKGLKITPGDLIIRRESPVQTGEYDILEGIEFKPEDFKRSEFLSTVASGVNAEREVQGLQPYEIVIPEELTIRKKDDDVWSKEAEERVDASIKAILDRFKKASEETVETVEETQEESQVLEEQATVNYAEEFKTAVLNGGESLDSVLRSIHESGFGYTETSTGKKLLVYKGEMVPRSDIGKLVTQSSPLIRVVAELEKSGAFESEEPLVISDEKLKASSYYRINHIRKAEGLDEIREVPVVAERKVEAVQKESPVSLTEMLDSVPGTTTEETASVADVSPADQVYARVQEYLSGFENAQTEEEKQQILTGLQGYLTPKGEVQESVAETTATQEQTQTDYAGFWNGRSR